MRKDATYPARFAEARERAAQSLEDEAVRRAHEGIKKPVLNRGRQVYLGGLPLYEHQHSDMLLIRLLEANDPSRFKRHVENTNLLDVDPDKLTPEQLDKIAEHLMAKALAGKPQKVAEEARRRLESGETVTIEGLYEQVGETEPKE
jgi:hypothetical protein